MSRNSSRNISQTLVGGREIDELGVSILQGCLSANPLLGSTGSVFWWAARLVFHPLDPASPFLGRGSNRGFFAHILIDLREHAIGKCKNEYQGPKWTWKK